MFEERIKKNLKDDEEIIWLVRKYPLVFAIPILFSAVFIIAPFFFLYPLFHWSDWGVLIFFILLAIGLISALRVFIVYSFNVFIITSQRIIDIDQRGFFDRTVSETTFDKIQDVSFRIKGIGQTLLHYGSVVIQTAGSQANLELRGIKDPEKIQEVVTKFQREIAEQELEDKSSNAELVELLKEIRDGVKKEDQGPKNDK